MLKNMKNYLIVFSIIAFSFFVRLYNFSDRLTFGPEQAISLDTSAVMIKEKLSLLGIENVQRFTSDGFMIFSGALFSYTLIPLLLIFDYDPLPISYFFASLNILTGIVFYYYSKKYLGSLIAVISLFLFMFSSSMINHSMFIWILNYLPLVGVFSFFCILEMIKNRSYKYIFYLGILSGVGFSLEYLYLITAVLLCFLTIYLYKNFLKTTSLFVLGAIIPNLPLVIFEIKHDFYHFNTLVKYTIDTINGEAVAGFSFYHVLHLYPIVFLIGAILIKNIFKSRIYIALILVIYLVINLNTKSVNFTKPVGMVDGLTITDIKDTAKIIAEAKPDNYNVVTLFDFDTRARTLRYYLNHIYQSKPNGFVDYRDSQSIYSLSKLEYDYNTNNPWELNVFKPYKVEKVNEIGNGYGLYKLTK